ncbi:MAG: metalloregulator ArsR/SmtB family transcription factor [Acidimicrobiales bacterium]
MAATSSTGTDSQPTDQMSAAACCPALLGPTLDDEEATQLASTLKALADPVRLRLVNLISRSGEACACDLPALLDRTQPTISHHLTILVKAGLLDREQRGKWAWFRLNPDRLTELCVALGNPECGSN